MIAKILNKMPAKNWELATEGVGIKPHKNVNLLIKQLIQRFVKGKQPVAGAFNQQNKNVNLLIKQLIQKFVKGKQPVVRAFGNPGQMNFPFEGFKIKEAGGGGDCFYRSIMEALGVGSGQFGELRKSAAENAKKFSEKLNRIISGLEAPTGSDIHLMNHLAAESPTGDASSYINSLIKEISLNGKLGGTHTAPFCARALGKQIFIYLKGTDGNLKVYGFDKDGRVLYWRDNVTAEILAQNHNRDRVNIWHNGRNHFQAIVPNNR